MNYLEFEDIKDLEFILSSDIFLSGITTLIDEEISNNMWCIAASSENIKKISVKKLNDFFDRLLEKRKRQIQELNITYGAVFYIWFEQDVKEIISDFISSPYHDGIPWEELKECECDTFDEDEEDSKGYTLKVFKKHISIGS
jgi:hypothetical protein